MALLIAFQIFRLIGRRTFKGREATVHDELQVTELALVEDDSWELLGLIDELLPAWGIAGNQILEDTTWKPISTKVASGDGSSQSAIGCVPCGGLAMAAKYANNDWVSKREWNVKVRRRKGKGQRRIGMVLLRIGLSSSSSRRGVLFG